MKNLQALEFNDSTLKNRNSSCQEREIRLNELVSNSYAKNDQNTDAIRLIRIEAKKGDQCPQK